MRLKVLRVAPGCRQLATGGDITEWTVGVLPQIEGAERVVADLLNLLTVSSDAFTPSHLVGGSLTIGAMDFEPVGALPAIKPHPVGELE